MPHKDPIERAQYMRTYGRRWRKQNRAKQNAAHDAYRRRNLKKFSAKAKRYMDRMWERDPVRARIKHRLRDLRQRCRRQGIPFDLTVADVAAPSHCPVLGIPLVPDGVGVKVGNGKRLVGGRKENSASIDRIRPELGYVRGNVRVISWRANRLRNDATLWEMERVVEYMRGLGLDPAATSPFATLPEVGRPASPAVASADQPTSPQGYLFRPQGP